MQIYRYNYNAWGTMGFTLNEYQTDASGQPPVRNTPVSPLVVLQYFMAIPLNNKILLVKLLRGISGLGLKEAKDEVEAVLASFPLENPGRRRAVVIAMVKMLIKHNPDLEAATQEISGLKEHFAQGLKERLANEKKENERRFAAEKKAALDEAKRKAQEIKDAVALKRKNLMAGLGIAYDHARALGYPDGFDAMRDLISRYENTSRNFD